MTRACGRVESLVEAELSLSGCLATEATPAADREPVDDDQAAAVEAAGGAQFVAPRQRRDEEHRVLEADACARHEAAIGLVGFAQRLAALHAWQVPLRVGDAVLWHHP